MEEKRDKDGVFLAPVTPAKLGCRVLRRAGVVARESLNSGDNAKLGSTNSDGNLLREGDFCRMLGTKAGFADTDSEKSSRIDGSNRTVGELGEISCMQLLLSQIGRPNHEVVGPPQTSANRSAEEAGSTHTNPPGVPETKASDAVGTGSLDSIPDSEEQSGRKRKKSSIDLNERPRQRMKVKKHRPKIFDASKPKKIPNVKIERKHTSKLRKTQKTPDLSLQAPKPPTPEPLAPRLVMCEGGISCEWKTVDENSQQARISCRKILDFDLADKVEEEGNDKNFDLLGNGDADVDNINDIALADVMFRVKSMRQTVHTYEHHRWQKSENKSIFSCLLRNLESESEIQDFGFSRRIREIIDEYHQWDVKALQFLHFPTAFKGRRTKRQRRTVYSKFRMCSKFEGNINVHGATTKTRLPARSHTMKNMVFRSKVPLSFNSVPKRKRSKPRRSDDMSVISSPNVESCCTPGKDSLPITRGVETCLLHVENKSSIVNETNEKTEVKFSMEAEMLYQIQENNLQHGNDLFQLESQNSVTTEAELFPVPTKAVTTEAKLFPVPTKVVTTEAELFPVPTKAHMMQL